MTYCAPTSACSRRRLVESWAAAAEARNVTRFSPTSPLGPEENLWSTAEPDDENDGRDFPRAIVRPPVIDPRDPFFETHHAGSGLETAPSVGLSGPRRGERSWSGLQPSGRASILGDASASEAGWPYSSK